MHPLFHITVDHIARLNDSQARELLARLCRAHLERAGLDNSTVYWGGDQRAKDGGVDVLIEHPPAVDLLGPLRRSMGVIQVKAEKFGPAKIGPEMAPEKVLRPAIASLADHNGTYLIASTHDNPAAPQKKKRIEAMENVLDEHGLLGKVQVDFLGAREIANWVEQFPPLAIWVRQAIGNPLNGWKSYGPWAYLEEDTEAPFVLSDGHRVFAPGTAEAMTDLDGINAIRADLRAGRSVRLVGLSGVGKTRLAQALFDPRIKTSAPPLSPDQAIYTDMSDRPDPSPESMMEALVSAKEPAILIVDNCGQDTHDALVAKKGKSAKALGLLTIEYDVRDDIPDDTHCYRLEGSSDEALRSVVRSHHPNLSSPDVATVISASQGNARLAFALASTSQQTGDLASLRSDQLFRRLFEQKHGPKDELLRCAKAASLIYSFEGKDISSGSEVATLAAYAEVSPATFRANMILMGRRRLLQRRGRWFALLPHAVSNRLAAEALEELDANELQERLFRNASTRIRASFANRLSYLHSSPNAKEIVRGWLAPRGDLGAIGDLSNDDFKVFQRIASVDQSATLSCIERFIDKGAAGGRSEYALDSLAHILHSIAYECEYFDRAVDALLKLHALQPEKRGESKREPEDLRALFQIAGSGTLAPTAQRAAHVYKLLTSSDPALRQIGVLLLVEALKVKDFRIVGTLQFGARPRKYGQIFKDAERRNWFQTFMAIAEPLAVQDSNTGRTIRAALGQAVSGLIHDPILMEDLKRLSPRLIEIDGWLPALKAVRQFLRREGLADHLLDRASEFEKLVSPQGLRHEVLAAIAMRHPSDYAQVVKDGVDPNTRAAENSETLGRQLSAEPALLEELLPRLLSNEVYGQAYSIGRGVAFDTTDAGELMAQVKAQLLSSNDPRLFRPTFVNGLFSGWHEQNPELVDELLDQALIDPALGIWFPDIQGSVPIDTRGVARILDSIAAGQAPIASYSSIGYQLKPVTVANIARIVNALADHGIDGIRVAVDLLYTTTFRADDRSTDEQIEVAELCRDFMVRTNWQELGRDGDASDYELIQIIAFGATHSAAFEDIEALLHRVATPREGDDYFRRMDTAKYLSPILHKYPHPTLSYLLEQHELPLQHSVTDMVLEAWVSDHSGQERPAMEADGLVDWCAADPGYRIDFCIQICPLGEPVDAAQSVAARLYALAPNKPFVILGLEQRCMRSGSSDEILPDINAVLRLLHVLPTPKGSLEEKAVKMAIESLRKQLDWWKQMLENTGEERDEGFE